MYGYIRPDRSELRLKDLENYQAAYCGLCHALSERCGLLSRLTVSYDLTLLVLLLTEEKEQTCLRRCPRHPFSRKRCLCACKATAAAADRGMILSWWKLRDAVRDGGLLKSLGASLASAALRRAYRRAAEREPDFDALTRQQLEKLSALEEQKCDSIDRTADCFARILSAAAAGSGERQRVLEELLYHVGRSIYLLDAADDLEEDRQSGGYNPLLQRFGEWNDEAREALRGTLNLSQRRAAAALSLLRENGFTPILENIITLGLPEMTELVLAGEWKNRKKLLRGKTRESGTETI